MDTIFRVLFLHMRTFWRRARGLFVSIWFQRLHTSGSQKNAPATRIHRPPTPIPPSPSGAASRIAPKISMARTKVWACLRARKLKAQMRERRVAKKQAMYARIAARVTAVAVGKGKEGTKGEDEEEDEEEEVQEEDGHFDAPLPSSEPRVDTYRLPSPLPLPHWGVSSTFGLELRLELGYDFPSPTDSCASSSGSTTTAPRTPVTPMTPTTTPLIPRNSIHFPGTRECMATESPRMPATLRANHVRRDPRARGRFRTLSASITARSPLSLSFPISFSLPLAARRASSPNVTLQRYMMDGTAYREGVDGREGEDPFGTHGSGYYAPGEWTALGHGDAYDLSAWAWACDRSPHRRAKKRMRAATVGSASVYRAPVHAASAPQLTYAQHTDGQLEHSRRLANASAGVAGEKISRVVRMPMPANTSTHENETATGSRRGMRPLILPQKLGLLTIGAASGSGRKPEYGAERAEWEIKASGWDVDLERGVCRGQEVAGT